MVNQDHNSRDGAVVRVLASHQRVLGSIPGPGIICGLSLLLVLYSALRCFSPHTSVFPSPQKPTFPGMHLTFLNEFLCTPWCFAGKPISFTLLFTQYQQHIPSGIQFLPWFHPLFSPHLLLTLSMIQ